MMSAETTSDESTNIAVADESLADQSTDTPAPTNTPAPAGFAQLPLDPSIVSVVHGLGYAEPTAVQRQIIPHMIEGRDVLVQSQTGSGKTAAFALPILSSIETGGKAPLALVLAPTRELAVQVAESFKRYAAAIPNFNVAAIYGGQDYEIQLRQLRRGVQVVVGTPGRVIDHLKRETLNLSQVETLVLDEADEMLNMGFLDDVQYILDHTPPQRQTALYSATLPEPIKAISKQYLRDPAIVTIKRKQLTADSIRQRALVVHSRDKIRVLGRILEAEETDGVIVFTKTKEATLSVAEKLNQDGFSAIALNGDMPQKVRERAIDQLKSGRLDILVATDVAARGLDVPRISHVINFDLPHDSESYVHRIGRTGRAGRKGEAILLLTNAQRRKLGAIERLTKQKIEIVDAPTADEINAQRVARFKEQITKMIAEQDLTMFKELISQHISETGQSAEMVAAALAQIGLQGRKFFVRELPAPAHRKQRDDHRSDRRNPKGERRDRKRGHQDSSEFDHERKRYRIEVGRRDGATPRNIVGAIANEAGIDGQFIGPIKIFDSFALVDLPKDIPADVFQTLQRTRVSGKPIQLKTDRGGKSSHRGAKFDRSFKKKKKRKKA